MGRLDNLFGSPWLNLKLGKFELDNLVSENANSNPYQHFWGLRDSTTSFRLAMATSSVRSETTSSAWNGWDTR